jgi:hypothetical protein
MGLPSFVRYIHIQRFGMVLNVALADRAEKPHDFRIVAPLEGPQHAGSLHISCRDIPTHRHDSRIRKFMPK